MSDIQDDLAEDSLFLQSLVSSRLIGIINNIQDARDEIERLRKQLEMSEKRFAALKEAYDKNRRRNIQLYGSNKIDGAGVPWSPKKLTEPEALGEKE